MLRNTINPFLRLAPFFFFFALLTLSSAGTVLTRTGTGSGRAYARCTGAVSFFGAEPALLRCGAVFLVDLELNIFMTVHFFLFG